MKRNVRQRLQIPRVTTRRLWSGPDVDSVGSPSPDGKSLSFVDWSTGAGNLTHPRPCQRSNADAAKTRGDIGEFAYQSVFSPDGKRIAYGFQSGDMYDLRVVGTDGSAMRTVFHRTESLDVIPMAWSPDGTQILAAVRMKDSTSQIAIINAETGATRVLKTLGWQYPRLALSPDGRYIAYDFTRDETSTKHDIAILSADGGSDIPIAAHAGNDSLLGWSPDGRLFFLSDRGGSSAVWTVRVTNGRAAADPVRLNVDLWRFERSLGFDKNGVFYYSMNPTVADLYVATIDPASLKVTTAPQPVVAEDGGTHGPGAWSPDGRLVAYLASDGAASVSFSGVAIRSLETGDQRVLTPALSPLRSVQWFPDGRSLLVGAADLKGRQGFYRLDAQSGAVAVVHQQPSDAPNMFSPSCHPTERRCTSDPDVKRQNSLVMARALRSGAERELSRFPGQVGWPSPSGDGKQLAFAVNDRATRQTSIVVLPVTGGQARTVLTLPEGYMVNTEPRAGPLGGDEQLDLHAHESAKEAEVWSVRLDGSGAQKLDLNVKNVAQARLHPDGRRLLFRSGELTKEIWALQPSSSR